MDEPVIRLTLTDLKRIGVRDIFPPSHGFVGKMWRTSAGEVWIIGVHEDRMVGVNARWERVPHRRLSVIPPMWRDWARQYARQWPESARYLPEVILG